ncbi:hypothetical protein [Hymenobacter volaticus]|uniref:Lipocalin-like domain-containing protein n=1 Tax=Hymenobacter volaticus TaxID=2932254 RepID=A0ABY4GB66_9BACT|nr:hypothetical protein [Hymenobacter volaticus]UOQ68015.1 hypothetical protein MUN86_09245 [Hymenobacter volaticus]
MKTSLISRLSLVCLMLMLSATMAMAQKVVYSEAPMVAKSGYWSLVTDQSDRSHTVVQFYNDQHELLYEERLDGLCLNPCKSRAAHRRVAKMLGATLQQVQRMQSNSMVSTKLVALNRHTLREYATR